MPLLDFWKSTPTAVEQLAIDQVVSSAGNGILLDNSVCCHELQTYLSQVPSPKLGSYIDQCLSSAFGKSGFVLQDLVNELGRRLDYEVTNGRYQGIQHAVGFDGIWVSPQGHTIIVEVKTTDTYRIALDTIVGYRDKLELSGTIKSPNSILIVVGRQDTGELEAQVRGSRHAWDVRLISAEALIKLVLLKEGSEAVETGLKIRGLLTPMEYTKLDKMIDVMFTTAKDVETAVQAEDEHEGELANKLDSSGKAKGVWQFTETGILEAKREQIIKAVGKAFGSPLIKKSRALYWSSSHDQRAACTISKRYVQKGSYPYWYAYHPQWDEFLREGTEAVLALGCMDLSVAFAIPWSVISDNLKHLNTTTTKDEHTYWQVKLIKDGSNGYSLLLPKKSGKLAISGYSVDLST